jgi:hypothetical protein
VALQRPELAAPMDAVDVAATVTSVLGCQNADGSIPWADGHIDPWNHIEAAMALDVGRRHREAERAYRWLARRQRPDGSWYCSYRHGAPDDFGVDANFCAYIAAGLWHHTQVTGDDRLLRELWSCVEGGVGVAVDLQQPGGEVIWARRPDGEPHRFALITSSSCIHLSLRKAIEAAGHLGLDSDGWERAADRVAGAVAHHPELFAPRSEFSMDWYYPVLGGAVTGTAARLRMAREWDTFVIDELGCRCVADHDWVTGAETCELVLALDAIGRHEEAWQLFAAVQNTRDDDDGAYWTGVVLPESCPWPVEKPAWTGAAVVLAADALLGLSAASGFFRALHDQPDEELFEAEGA